ncbi:hypothetical protein [Streptomyces sp. NPDC006335]|uniref:hypothetical protein n=1 Tax=Streptomyces sp. NPDC006335 TaxID=3156895 RepID=UPI0033A45430
MRTAGDIGMYAAELPALTVGPGGLAGIPQTVLGVYADTVREFLGVPAELKLLFGISFGTADPAAPVNKLRTERVPLQQGVVLHDTPWSPRQAVVPSPAGAIRHLVPAHHSVGDQHLHSF